MVASCLESIRMRSTGGHGRRCRQMVASCLESIRMRSTGIGTDIFWLWSDPILDTLLLDAILSLKANLCSSISKENKFIKFTVQNRLYYIRASCVPIGVATVDVGTLRRAKNGNWLRSVEFCSRGANDNE